MALSNQRLDFLLQNLTSRKTSDLRVMLEKLKFHLGRLIEQMFKRFGNWRLFGAYAMLRIHGHWGSSSVKDPYQNRLDEAEDEAVRRAHRGLLDEIERRIEDLEEEIDEHVKEDSELERQCSLLEKIPGIGLQTAAIVVAELGSPERFESARLAAAYAGLVPRHHESGTSVRGAPRMSGSMSVL